MFGSVYSLYGKTASAACFGKYPLPLEKAVEEILYWRRKYEEEKEKNKKLDFEVDKLKKEIDKLTKTGLRYQVALFDHGNFKNPLTDANKKEKGGQADHPDTNREKFEDYRSYQKKECLQKHVGDAGIA